MLECLSNIVALAQTDCECSQQGRPEDYNESTSGIAIDSLTPIGSLLGSEGCGADIWEVLTKARTSAIQELAAIGNAKLSENFKPKRKPVSHELVGTIKAKQYYDASKAYAVVRFKPARIKSGYALLREMALVFEANGAVDIDIYDNVDGLLHSFENLETVAGAKAVHPIADSEDKPLYLPMYSKYEPELEYYFVYTFDPANRPKATQVKCKCGGFKPSFDTNYPYYLKSHNKYAWANYGMFGGIEIDDLEELEDELPSKCSNDMFGLALTLDFGCKVEEVFCEQALDFKANTLALSLAQAVNYLSAHYVAKHILTTDSNSFANLVNAEDWAEYHDQWYEAFEQHLNYVIDQIDIHGNDCLECKDLSGMVKQGIFA